MTFTRRRMIWIIPAIAAIPAVGHHAWAWTHDGPFALTGTITQARLNTPKKLLNIDAKGERWQVELDRPRRQTGQKLTYGMLRPGTELTLLGTRSDDPDDRRMVASAVRIAGHTYKL